MKRLSLSAFLIFACLFATAIPCGPALLSPVFQIRSSPEFPYEDFAAGNIGIIRPQFHRSVLFAAHRYVTGEGFTADEQKALVEVWKAEFRKEDFRNIDVDEAVKKWIDARRTVAADEEQPPKIYAEREYGGYDLFPNCTVSAFETATETLGARAGSYGSDDRYVREWLRGQDTVFANCASGKAKPLPVDVGMPEWLQKDRAYQLGAAAFYSMDYEEARARFGEIALDFASPWQETADYLVGRTLIRQASVGRGGSAERLYREAEEILQRISDSGGRFAGAADELLGLVKYRLHPAERLNELAVSLTSNAGNRNFRQDVIDFAWLMDKFERAGLEDTERRSLAAELRSEGITDVSLDFDLTKLPYPLQSKVRRMRELSGIKEPTQDRWTPSSPDKLRINLYAPDYSKNWSFEIDADATDADALAAAEAAVGGPLSDELRKKVIEARENAYADRFSTHRDDDYQGGYWGDLDRSLASIPPILRDNGLTDWLFVYQLEEPAAYRYALDRFKQGGGPIWLMTAISKAHGSSPEIGNVLAEAERSSRTSPAFLTIAFNAARVYLDQNKTSDALRMIADAENYWPNMPVSSLNRFRELRQKAAGDLDTYLRSALRRPFIFEYGGSIGSVEQLMEQEKGYYNPEYHTEGREAYEAGVEEEFADVVGYARQEMFDDHTINIIDLFFPLTVLKDAYRSPSLPEHLRSRFALAVFTRSLLLGDDAAANEFAPIVAARFPDLAEAIRFYQAAPPGQAKQDAATYLILKDRRMTPFVRNGYEYQDWWCEPSDYAWDGDTGSMIEIATIRRPPFLTQSNLAASKSERARLTDVGNAPRYLANYVLDWAKRSPADPRVPESLAIAFDATAWNKFGCGNDWDIRKEVGSVLTTKYPNSPWTEAVRKELEAEEQ